MRDVSGGRMVIGIGRGDSSRRVVGLTPVKVGEFGRRIGVIKDLMNGRKVEWNGKEIELAWVRKDLPEIPMYVAGYGPRALGAAGRVGDGVVIQLADPQIIEWTMDTARKAAAAAGRDPTRSNASSAPPATFRPILPMHASRCAGSRQWFPTTLWT
jgi:alkanesulfonate monooxygenase SsuD/methylene tetrahydromethanopterin reductase-like flavin-dependent oxidoreductase (luciferase family)